MEVKVSPGKKLMRRHLNQRAECGGRHLWSQLSGKHMSEASHGENVTNKEKKKKRKRKRTGA
jgi:hypothetical protein